MPEHVDCVALPEVGTSCDELAISTICNAQHKAPAAAGIESMRSDTSAALYKRRGFRYASLKEPPQAEQK
jgi:hypothetical protein